MKRTNAPGATVDNKFTDGDPTTATPSTQVEQTWLNSIQEEICYVIEFGGAETLDANDTTQLWAAIQYMIDQVDITVPDASTTVKGIIEIATNSEATAGSDTVRAVTPSGLKAHVDARVSSTTVAGLVELATDAETQTGSDAVRAVTPASLASLTATLTRRGLVELATTGETQTGTDADRAVTPAGLAAVVSSTTARGLIELATDAEAQALTDTTRAISPSSLAGAFKGGNQSFGGVLSDGYQRLPGGLILQWGYGVTDLVLKQFNFPLEFPNICYNVTVSGCQYKNSTVYDVLGVDKDSITTAKFDAFNHINGDSNPVGQLTGVAFFWFAIGR